MSTSGIAAMFQRLAGAATAVIVMLAPMGSSALAQQPAFARLINVQGTVLVDAGAGFAPVSGNIDLKLGDRVMVVSGGTAVLVYADDCEFTLESPSDTTVNEEACPASAPATIQAQAAAPLAILGSAGAAGGLIWYLSNQEDEDQMSP